MTSIRPPLAELRAQCRALVEVGAGSFLRRSGSDDFLFVSDLPRHAPAQGPEAVLAALARAGFVCHQGQGLLFIDASREHYERLLEALPLTPPPLPRDEALHPAYALCSLLLAHPAPLTLQPLAPLRRVLKLTEAPSSAPMLQAVSALHQEAALALRQRRPPAHAAGQVLAAWLMARP